MMSHHLPLRFVAAFNGFADLVALGRLWLALMVSGWVFAGSVLAQPAQDSFATRLVIEGENVERTDSNRGASMEPGEPNHSGDGAAPANSSIWYTWRAPRAGVVLIELVGSSFDTSLGLYEGKEVSNLRILRQNNDAAIGGSFSRLTWPVEAGADYQIGVGGVRGGTGDVRLVLRMLALPEFDRQPADATRRYEEDLNLEARAFGTPPLSFQWYFNGSPIPGRSGQLDHFELPLSLMLTNLTVADEGVYWVEVGNANGRASSRRAQVTVSQAPYFRDQPDSRIEPDGVDVAFEAVVAGRAPISYQWRLNGAPLPGRTGQTLLVANAQRTNEGAYSVVATNPWGSVTSTNATLAVTNTLPRILAQPVGVTNTVGSRVLLTVVGTGARVMGYQWFRDGVVLPGQVSSNFVLVSATIADTGDYQVEVSNSRGATNSRPARIKILPPPPNDNFVDATPIIRTNYPVLESGYNVGATSEAGEPRHEGAPAVQSVWWRWKAPARGLASVVFTNTAFNPRVGLYSGDGLTSLSEVAYRTPFSGGTVSWLTDPDGEYWVAIDRAQNLSGDLSFYFAFTTNLAPPVILVPPVNKELQACETLTLSVVATNVPTNLRYPLSYQWRKDGVPIPGANEPTYTVKNAQVLRSGIYDVEVTNYGGTTTSVTCRCEIKSGPKIVLQPPDLSLRLCDSSQLQVAAVGCPPILFQWQLNGESIVNATNEVLRLSNVDVVQGGLYSAVVINPDGVSTSRVARVTINASPRISGDNLLDTVVRECANQTFRVTIEDVTCRPLGYQWYFNRTNAIRGANTNILQLVGVQTNQAGLYSLVVSNVHASSTSRVARLTVSALPIIPSDQPSDRRRVRLGDSFSLRVDPQSCTPMTYQWLYNGSPILPGTNTVLLTNVTVVATNIFRQTNVVSATNSLGGTLVITRSTNTVISTNLVSATNVISSPMIVGTNQSELVFHRPSTNLNGRYRVEVRNSAGMSISREALVEILVPPPNDHFSDRTRIIGTNTVVTGHDIIATREPGEPRHVNNELWERSIWWTWQAPDDDGYLDVDLSGSTYDTQLALYRGEVLERLERLASDEGSAGGNNARVRGLPVLAESRIQIAVDGRSNSEGQARLRLTFNADTNLPIFSVHPRSVAVLPGGTARFEVDIKPTPRSQFQWQINEINLPGQTNRTLILTNVLPTKADSVVCLARNKYGETASARALLTTAAILVGRVTDATNKRPSPFARVSVGEGSAEVFTLTDTNGNYELAGAVPGSIRADFEADRRVVGLRDRVEFQNLSTLDGAFLAGSATNYFRYEDRNFRVVSGTIITNSFSMSPQLVGGLRFVLNWGLNPADLDLHVRTPSLGGRTYEIDYRNPYRGNPEAAPWGQLDVDETRSYGPETVTMTRFSEGIYQVWVQKFDPSAQGSLASSGATLKIYDNSGLIRVVDVPRVGNGLLWHAVNVHGSSREIIIVNRIVGTLVAGPSSGVAASAGKDIGPLPGSSAQPKTGSQLSYQWQFGDTSSSDNLSERVLHQYSKPGVYTVSLAMSARVNGTMTNTGITRTNFITVTNDPPRIRITAPAPRTIFRQDAPLVVTAEASDSDGRVTNVFFFANGRLIGSSASPPYRVDWTPRNEEMITLTAEAVDEHGARAISAPVVVSSRDLNGNVLIVRNADDPEIREMASLIEEVKCDRGQPLVVRILERSEITFELMSSFQLIVWNHLQPTNPPLSVNEVGLFQRCYDSGIPLYFMGEDLAGMTRRMSSEARTQWTSLAKLLPGASKIGPGLVERATLGGSHDILYSAYSEFEPFRYGGNIDSATADPAGEVLLVSGEAPILVAYPSSNENSYEVRRVTQNFRLVDPVGDMAAEVQRRQLFQATVAWLIECPSCPLSDLQLHAFQATNDVVRAGEPMTLAVEARHSGACDPTGVNVSVVIPPGLRLVSTSPTNAVRVGDSEVLFRLGRRPNGFVTNLHITLVSPVAGPLVLRSCISGNTGDAYPADNCREISVDVGAGIVRQPPRLAVGLQGSSFRIDVQGPVAQEYQLEYSTNLQQWLPAVVSPQSGASGWYFIDPTTVSSRAYRVIVK